MRQFIELHYSDGEPVIINTGHIAYIRDTESEGCYIYLACSEWNSSNSGHMHSFHVKESYSRVKSIIFEYE